MLSDDNGSNSRTGGLSISLSSPDGRVIGGGVGGMLIASSPVQVFYLASFFILLKLVLHNCTNRTRQKFVLIKIIVFFICSNAVSVYMSRCRSLLESWIYLVTSKFQLNSR